MLPLKPVSRVGRIEIDFLRARTSDIGTARSLSLELDLGVSPTLLEGGLGGLLLELRITS